MATAPLREPNPETWAGRQGRVTPVLEEVVRPGDAGSPEVNQYGGQRMVEDCTARLKEKGFPEESLHHENFFWAGPGPGQGFLSRAA
ncbi:MAG: hypothetical protein LJF30_13795 [Acidobacteria bacterium]|jgi:NAD(P)H-flavin reductase|nr:hypothetical protein [Acidobacteriota bacterium]